MINTKRTWTSLEIICNEKEALWTHIAYHCKATFKTMKMPIKIPQDLDLHPTLDQRGMKAIDVDYIFRVGYWALRNNV